VHDAGDGTFACERYKLGAASPGPVTDEEYLNLIISDPQSLDPRSGYVLPLLVKQVDMNGVSVLRDAAANIEFETTLAELKRRSDAKGKPRYFHGVFRFLAADVRLEGQDRWLGVYDTSLPSRVHHADIMAPPLPTRREREARIKRLLDKISHGFHSVEHFRDGALAKHGRSASA
jgi:hypothetical protein